MFPPAVFHRVVSIKGGFGVAVGGSPIGGNSVSLTPKLPPLCGADHMDNEEEYHELPQQSMARGGVAGPGLCHGRVRACEER